MSDKNIAKILAAWNPLDVPSYIAKDEYSSYVPMLKGMDEAEIYEWLQSFIKETLGVKRISPQRFHRPYAEGRPKEKPHGLLHTSG